MDSEPSEPRPIKVHRCRFVDYHPSAITAIAFPPRPLPRPSTSKSKSQNGNQHAKRDDNEKEREITPGLMAIGRANGNIELYDWAGEGAAQAWVLRATLYGPSGSKVDNLVFTLRHPHLASLDTWSTASLRDLRLFSTTSSPDLLEWSLTTLSIVRTLPSGGGSIWSLAANAMGTRLALGCEDGGVRVVSLRDGGLEPEMGGRWERGKARLLSVAWGPPVLKAPKPSPPKARSEGMDPESDDDEEEDEEELWEDTYLLAGCSDSSLRKYSAATGRLLDRLTLDKLRGEPTLAWSVAVLPDGRTGVSGDSMGRVSFWDLETGTLVQGLESHAADVLALAVGPDGNTVYSTGIDQKITQHVRLSPSPSQPGRWVQTSSRRLHAHDVRALAVFPPPVLHPRASVNLTCPILVSGGLDLSPTLTPAAGPEFRGENLLKTSKAATWEESWHRRVPFAKAGDVILARKRGWVVCKREQAVGVWFLRSPSSSPSANLDPGAAAAATGVDEKVEEGGWVKALEMELTGQGNLVCVALGEPDDAGEPAWLAVSDGYEVKLWRLLGQGEDIRPKRVKGFAQMLLTKLGAEGRGIGASALAFTPDASRLLIASTPSSTPASTLLVVDLQADPTIVAQLRATNADNTPIEPSWISHLAMSPDGAYLASLAVSGQLNTYNLRTLKRLSTLPSFPSHPVALHFLPPPPQQKVPLLVIALANNSLHAYSLQYSRLDDSTKRPCTALTKRLATRHDPILGLSTRAKPEGKAELFVWSSSWVCKVDLLTQGRKAGSGEEGMAAAGHVQKKRKRPANSEGYDIAASISLARDTEGEAEDFPPVRVETRYKYVCLVDFVRCHVRVAGNGAMDVDGEDYELQEREGGEMMVVVERPIADVLTEGPPAWSRKKFGT